MVSGTKKHTWRSRWADQHVLLVGLWFLLVMLAVKVWAGWATRSLSLAAAALHTLVTSFSLLLSVLALSISTTSGRKGWGHTRLESSLTLLLVGFLGAAYCFLVGVAAHQVGFFGSGSITAVQISAPLFHLLATLALITLGLSLAGYYWSRQGTNALLQFTSGQAVQDAGLLVVVLLGLVGVGLGFTWLDLALAGAVLLVAAFNVWRIVNWQLPSMLRQVAIAPEAIARLAHQVEGVLHCYAINTQGIVGRMVMVEMRLMIHPECVAVAPAIAQRVKRLLTQHYGVVQVKLHIDPVLPGATNHRER